MEQEKKTLQNEKKTPTPKGKSERAKQRYNKRIEGKNRTGNSKVHALHGKGGNLSEGGFITSEPVSSEPVSVLSEANEKQFLQKDIIAIFDEYSDVIEALGIEAGLVNSQKPAERGAYLNEAIMRNFGDILLDSDQSDSELDLPQIDSNASLKEALKKIRPCLIELGYIDSQCQSLDDKNTHSL